MSCIRFIGSKERQQFKENAPSILSADETIPFSAPAFTESKAARLITLATSDNPKVRERVALDYHASQELLDQLAHDPDEGVRACVARSEHVSCDILRGLSADASEAVRGFVVWNRAVPEDVVEVLSSDPSVIVQALIKWRTQMLLEAQNG